MRVIHKQAVQAHAVPSQILEARGPFPRYVPQVVGMDGDPDAFPSGATAQNDMQGGPTDDGGDLYECRACLAVLHETELDSHVCEGDL